MTAYEHDTRQALTRADGRAQPDADAALVAYLRGENERLRRERNELRAENEALRNTKVNPQNYKDIYITLMELWDAAWSVYQTLDKHDPVYGGSAPDWWRESMTEDLSLLYAIMVGDYANESEMRGKFEALAPEGWDGEAYKAVWLTDEGEATP